VLAHGRLQFGVAAGRRAPAALREAIARVLIGSSRPLIHTVKREMFDCYDLAHLFASSKEIS
jgi:hypothetical protein